jgi:hypothetical protein
MRIPEANYSALEIPVGNDDEASYKGLTKKNHLATCKQTWELHPSRFVPTEVIPRPRLYKLWKPLAKLTMCEPT